MVHEDYSHKIQILHTAKTNLKAKFIGIDEIIDQLFEYLHIWYLMPQILMRPMIINLWGMTGVGKTDLIRSLVDELKMQNQFLEVELSAEGRTYGWDSSVADTFASRGLEAGSPNIILFDEIQKFRSLDDKGEEIKVPNFQDFWELLSDGKISDKGKGKELLEMFNDTQITMSDREDQAKTRKPEDEPIVESKIGLWQATKLKKMIKIKMTVLEIARMTYTDFAGIMQEVFDKDEIYKPMDYNQSLIIISGNLDEAYVDARAVGEVEVDADIFHSSTTKINMLNIKEALSKRFRPEQISRFGNIHLIYRSLNKSSYQKLITLKTRQICLQIKDKLNIEAKVDNSLNELIYNNGVFPAQGVRPVFSTITEILECNLSKYLFEAVQGGFDQVNIKYNKDKALIEAKISNSKNGKSQKIKTPFVGRIDQIKLIENTQNLKALTAVHESGHALIYILNFSLSPLQLKSNIASTASYGFTFSHKIHLTKDFLLKKIQIYLAGHLAEKLVFGEDKTSIGHTTDWREATSLASDFIRRFGYGKATTSIITTITNSEADKFNTNIDLSNTEIEELLQDQLTIVIQILKDNQKTLIDLSKTLLENSSLTPQQVQEICSKHDIKCDIENENFVVYEKYSELLERL